MKRTSLFAALAAAAVLTAPLVAQAATTTPTKTKTSASQSSVSTAKPKHAHMAKLDLNTASKEDLMKLKGMTDAEADKIIAARPFTSVSELKSKNIVDAAEYGKIRSWVTVKKVAAAKK